MGNYTFKHYTLVMLGVYAVLTISMLGFIHELRTYIVAGFAIGLLLICALQFFKYKNTYLYQIPLNQALAKEPSMYWLALIGVGLAAMSDSQEPILLAIYLSCAMLNLKYVIMHVQLKYMLKLST